MKVTDRENDSVVFDFCLEWNDGVYIWISDNKIVDSNDMLEISQINDVLRYLLNHTMNLQED